MNTQNTLIMIQAWSGGQQVMDMLMPFWRRFDLPIIVTAPLDSPCITSEEYEPMGRAGHCGPEATRRMLLNLNWFMNSTYDNLVLAEYDTLCLADQIDVQRGLHGIVKPSTEPERFICPRYLSPPWTMDRLTAADLLDMANTYTDFDEEGYADRMVSAWAIMSGIPPLGHQPTGFANNTITEEDYPILDQRLNAGGRWFHGVKSEAVLNRILSGCR